MCTKGTNPMTMPIPAEGRETADDNNLARLRQDRQLCLVAR